MKLATLNDGSRDGLLAVVSRDLTRAHFAVGIASTVQQLLDDWNFRAPQLDDLYVTLNSGKPRHAFAFDPRHCMAPLPRAYRCVFGRRRPPDPQTLAWTTVSGDGFLGPCEGVPAYSGTTDPQVDEGVAVVTADLPCGASDSQALEAVRLFLLVQHGSAREFQDDGHHVRVPLGTNFSPVAVTVDELADCWKRGHIELALLRQGRPGPMAAWPVGQTLARLVRHQRLGTGSIVSVFGSVDEEPGAPPTRLQLDAVDGMGQSIFGAIDRGWTPVSPDVPPVGASPSLPVQFPEQP